MCSCERITHIMSNEVVRNDGSGSVVFGQTLDVTVGIRMRRGITGRRQPYQRRVTSL